MYSIKTTNKTDILRNGVYQIEYTDGTNSM